jgi:hypothetical protein
MHTIKIIAGGLLLLALGLLGARFLGTTGNAALAAAAKYFIPVWLCLAVLNLWVGVSRAGYSVTEETPVLVVVFSVPAAIAAVLWWRLSRG